MALAVRELELILIARDHASATIARIGGGLAIMGGAMIVAGARASREFGEMALEAMEFRNQVALAVTQADGLGANIENVSGIIKRVGGGLSVPFEELHEALFDIFSTFTSDQLSSLEQAEEILRAFGESAVAGQAPVRDIGRAVIGWINALDQPATIENVNRILDIQFELVRKGAGTYTEFAGQIGKSIPAFVAAGQSTETFGAMLAFMTKNSVNAAMASTSAARAVELLFSPRALSGLAKVGVAVEDGTGEFRNMIDILKDLKPVFDGLTASERKIKFKEIFGTGRIQARRFFDLALPNLAELEELFGDMAQSGGEVQRAFALMFGQPLEQMKLFQNKWKLLRLEIGERFVATLEAKVFPALAKFFDWWTALDEAVKDNIARWLGWGAAILIVGGALTFALGIGLLFYALLKAFSGTTALAGLGKLAVSLGWVSLAIALIAGAAYLLWKNWEKVKGFFINLWETLKEKVSEYVDKHREKLTELWTQAKRIWGKITALWTRFTEGIKENWEKFKGWTKTFWDKWGGSVSGVWDELQEKALVFIGAILNVIEGFVDFVTAIADGDWREAWEIFKSTVSDFWEAIKEAFFTAGPALAAWFGELWEKIKTKTVEIWEGIKNWFAGIWESITSGASDKWNAFKQYFIDLWVGLKTTVVEWIEGKGGILKIIQDLPGNIILGISTLANKFVAWAGESFGALLGAIVEFTLGTLIPWFIELPGNILEALNTAQDWLFDTGWKIIKGLKDGLIWYWDNIVVPFWKGMKNLILVHIPNAWNWLLEVGKDIGRGIRTGVRWAWDNLIVPWAAGIGAAINTAIGSMAETLVQAGKDVLAGFLKGLKAGWLSITSWVSEKFGSISGRVKRILGERSPSKVMKEIGGFAIEGFSDGMKREMKPALRMLENFASDISPTMMPQSMDNMLRSNNTTTNNDNGQSISFGDIVTQGDPEEVMAEISWLLRMA